MATRVQPTTTVTIRIPQQMKDDLEKCAVQLGLTPSQFSKNVLSVGLEEFHSLQKFGVIRACIMIQAVWDALPRRVRVKHHEEVV